MESSGAFRRDLLVASCLGFTILFPQVISAAPIVTTSVSCSIAGVSLGCPASNGGVRAFASTGYSLRGLGTTRVGIEGTASAEVDAPQFGEVEGAASASLDLLIRLTTGGPVRPGILSYGISAIGDSSQGVWDAFASIVGFDSCSGCGFSFEAPFMLGVPFELRIVLNARAFTAEYLAGADAVGLIQLEPFDEFGTPVVIVESPIPEPSYGAIVSLAMAAAILRSAIKGKLNQRPCGL